MKFDIDPFRKHCLLNGLDDIGLTMEKAPAIDSFEKQARRARLGLRRKTDFVARNRRMQLHGFAQY